MKRIFYLLLILFPSYSLYAQNALSTEKRFPELKYSELTGTIYYKTYQQFIGTAFLDDSYREGRIFLQDGNVIENVKLKLDLFANELIVYQDIKQQLVIIDKENVKGFELNSNTGTEKYVRLQEIKAKSVSKYGSYVRVLTEGKNSFYKLQFKERITLQNPNGLYMYEFNDKTEYHLFVGGNDERIKLKRSTIKKLFPEYKSEVRKFIHQTRTKPRSEDGFAKIVGFINTLNNENGSIIKSAY